VAFPESTEEVAAIVHTCAGFQDPDRAIRRRHLARRACLALKGGICLDLSKMDQILKVNAEHLDARRTKIENDGLNSASRNLIPLLHATPAVADPIRYVISEFGRNVLEHAGSPVGGFICAQYFRNKQRIAIGMADAGIGIAAPSADPMLQKLTLMRLDSR
jgi:hypothetical protein